MLQSFIWGKSFPLNMSLMWCNCVGSWFFFDKVKLLSWNKFFEKGYLIGWCLISMNLRKFFYISCYFMRKISYYSIIGVLFKISSYKFLPKIVYYFSYFSLLFVSFIALKNCHNSFPAPNVFWTSCYLAITSVDNLLRCNMLTQILRLFSLIGLLVAPFL